MTFFKNKYIIHSFDMNLFKFIRKLQMRQETGKQEKLKMIFFMRDNLKSERKKAHKAL